MAISLSKITVLILIAFSVSHAARHKSDDNVLNVCMDGKHHAKSPSSTKLYGLCQPWESNSCCDNSTAYETQKPFSGLYNLNLSHCQDMSEKCLRSFYQMSCFYECSPNVGPWLKPVKSSIRNERFIGIPLCASDCEEWWDDCKDDFTCVDNFAKGFDWSQGTNRCPNGSSCLTFMDIFQNSTNFCEKIYPDDFKVEKNSSMCMTVKFTGPKNPNYKISLAYAKKNGMYIPSTTQPVTVSSSTEGTVVTSSVDGEKSKAVSIVVPIVALLIVILLGVCIYKSRNYIQTSKRAGTKFCPWFRKGRVPSHSIVHHTALKEDQQFLQEDRGDANDDCSVNPHGALEIDL